MDSTVFFSIAAIVLGIALDSLFGDPERLPHPVRLFGYGIALCDRHFNSQPGAKIKGVFTGAGLVLVTGASFYLMDILLQPFPWLLCLFNGVTLYYGISNRSLITESLKVERQLQLGNMEAARKQLSRIVGRDTSLLSETQIRTAVMETLSENLSDGVVAPLFYYALGGAPGIMMYKMVNTLDSMVGYKNERFADFGWFSARLDDAANYVPARLTALLMALVPPRPEVITFIIRNGKKHASPNSGYPEAALAGILDCRMGGPNVYQGKVVDKPYIGNNARPVTHQDIIAACLINSKVAVVSYLMLIVLQFA